MGLPSLDKIWKNGQPTKARIYVLEIHPKENPTGDPIAWLLVERQEVQEMDDRHGTLYDASIRLSYERILPKCSSLMPGKGCFSGGYWRGFEGQPLVSVTSASTSGGAVFLDLPGLEGQRIGTYLMNEIVRWVQQWPEARVRSVELMVGQAYPKNKARRNRFYEQFGLVFDFRDTEQKEGLSRPMLAGALVPVETWRENIRERDVREFFGEVLLTCERLTLEASRLKYANKNLSTQIERAVAHPIRWASRRLWLEFTSCFTWTALLLFLAAVAWLRLK